MLLAAMGDTAQAEVAIPRTEVQLARKKIGAASRSDTKTPGRRWFVFTRSPETEAGTWPEAGLLIPQMARTCIHVGTERAADIITKQP